MAWIDCRAREGATSTTDPGSPERAHNSPMPIIHSLLDTDLYKFTMMQVVLHQHPGARVQ